MDLIAVTENPSIIPMRDTSYSNTAPSDTNPFWATDEQMRTKAPRQKLNTVYQDFHKFTQTDLDDFDSQHIEQALQIVQTEAEEERRLDPELDAIQETAYKDVGRFLRTMYTSGYGAIGRFMSLADIIPLDNGEIGIEWREGQKIFTLSFGGDGHIVFAGIFSEESQARGILTFSTPHLFAIIDMITSLYPYYDY